jgi:hypothetical protein
MIETEYSNLITTIEGLGFRVYDDIMRVRPGGIIIDPPSYRSISPSIVEATYPINFVSLPPGNRKAMNECLAAIDTILESLSGASTMTANPGSYSVGGQELASYQITATITYRRDA